MTANNKSITRGGEINSLPLVCDYGCGKEAKHQLKNGKWCCSKHHQTCIKVKEQYSLERKGKSKKHSIKLKSFKNLNQQLCDYGCGKLAKFKSKIGKFCCQEYFTKCAEVIRKASISNRGKRRSYYTIQNMRKPHRPLSEETKQKMRKPKTDETKLKLRIPCTEDKKIKIKLKIKQLWADPKSKYNQEEFRNKVRKQALNGHALKMIKCIKNPSKEEIQLHKLVQILFPSCESQYSIFNYSVDIAIPKYKIAIEYDGWYHFNTEEKKQYHKQRQEKIESQGWKFYRVTMYDKFPTLEQIKEKIENLIQERTIEK